MNHLCQGTANVAKTVAFKAYRQFNRDDLKRRARASARLDEKGAALFTGPQFPDRIARHLAQYGIIRLKELLESFEFFERVRHRVRAPVMADLCCGHGLVGLLFAAMEREVEEVVLVDQRRPKLFERLWVAMCEITPWIETKIRFETAKLNRIQLVEGTSVLGVHACGIRTEYCLDLAVKARGAVAVMPCCYGQTGADAPQALKHGLGIVTATDVHRTYLLERAGYQVSWSAVPAEITPMNRIIAGTLPP